MKPVLLVLTLVGAVAVVSEVTVDSGLRDRNDDLHQELQQMRAANSRLETEVETLQTDIQRLRTAPEEALFQARTTLGMVRPGEVIYQVMPSGNSAGTGAKTL
jgi:cell division protein FtsB